MALIHFNRPPANSYNRAFIDGLNAAIDEIRFDESIHAAALVSDLPKFFSAGADINMFRGTAPQPRAMAILHAHEVLQKIERTPKVFVAAIGGHALGGGLEIALACDLRFGAEGDYRLGLPEATLGVLPGNGGTQRLPRLIGRSKALDLMIRGATVTPQQAFELGILDRLFAPERLLEETLEYIRQLAAGPTLAIGNVKISTRIGADLPLEGALALEREAVWRLFMTEDATEGMAAFAEKRKPRWSGR